MSRCLPWIVAAAAASALACGRSAKPTPSAPLRPPAAETRIELLQRLAAAEQMVGEHPPRRGFAALQDDIREALVVHVPTTLRFRDLPLHPGATLRFAFGAERPLGKPAAPVTFVVRVVDAAGIPVEPFRRSLAPQQLDPGAWIDAELPLGAAATTTTRVSLELEVTGGDPAVRAAWAWPEVVSNGTPGTADHSRVVADERQHDLLAELASAQLVTGPGGAVRRLQPDSQADPLTPAAALVPAGSTARWKLRLGPGHRLLFRYHVGRPRNSEPVAGSVGFALRLRPDSDPHADRTWRTLAERSVDLATLEPGPAGLRTLRETLELELPDGEERAVELELAGTGTLPPPSVRAALGALVLLRRVDVPRARRDRPGRNLVVLLVDTLRAKALGAYGEPRPTSPELDAHAARGLVFEDARAPVPSTVPSTGALLVGRYPTAEGPYGQRQRLPLHRVTLAEAAQRAGWTTAAFVANALLFAGSGFEQGFEEYHDVAFRDAAHLGRRAAEWIRNHRDERFLLYLHYLDPHAPYAAPEPWYGMFSEPYAGRVRRNTWSGRRQPWAQAVLDAMLQGSPVDVFADFGENARRTRERLEVGAALLQRLEQLYAGEVRYWDSELPRVLDALVAAEAWRHTVVAVTADHGEEFAEDRHLGHGFSLDDSAVHVPLVLLGAVPGPPRRIAAPVSLIDLAPLLLDLAGIPVPQEMQGRTLAELESGPPAPVFSTTLTYVRPEPDAPPGYQTAVRVRTPEHDLLHLVRDDLWLAPAPAAAAGAPWRPLPAADVPPVLRDAAAAFERELPEAGTDARSAGPDATRAAGPGLDLEPTADGRERDALRALGYLD